MRLFFVMRLFIVITIAKLSRDVRVNTFATKSMQELNVSSILITSASYERIVFTDYGRILESRRSSENVEFLQKTNKCSRIFSERPVTSVN